MTFADQSARVGRQVCYMVELELDWCSNVYSQAPCTANGSVSCYQTRESCQDPANWNPANGTRTYRFLPLGQHVDLHPDLLGAIPSLAREPNFASSEAEPGGLGRRGSVSIQIYDMLAGDNIDTDPYVANRLITATGTWWARFLARHKFYVGRPCRVYEGYADTPLTEWRVRHYVLEQISGPTTDGIVTVKAGDPLKQLDGDRAQVPTPTASELASNINPNTSVIPLTDAAGFVDGNYASIDDEVVLLNGFDGGSTFNNCSRGQRGTNNTNHSAGAAVQLVFWVFNRPLEEVIRDVCLAAGIDAALIPYAEWQSEISTFLPGQSVTGELWQPVSARKLLENELLPENSLSMFWDEQAQLIRLRVSSAFQTVAATFNEEDHIIDGRVQLKDEPRRQVTTARFFYGPISGRQGQEQLQKSDMQFFEAVSDADLEGADKYDRQALREFTSRWYQEGADNAVQLLAQTYVRRFGTIPQLMTFDIDAKDIDSVRVGDVLDVLTDQYVDFRGSRMVWRGQILAERALIPGHRYQLTLLKYFPAEASTIPDTFTISANTTNFDLFVALGGPPNPFTIELIVAAGVTVSSTSTGLPALTTGNVHPDSVVNLVRESSAIIVGAGGGGGGENGSAGGGGDAVEYRCDGSINNLPGGGDTGYIAAGGGGGGEGGDLIGTEGGGGGAGQNAGTGGVGAAPGESGQPGTATTGGQAGQGFSADPEIYGGRGGDLGQPGSSGRVRVDTAPETFVNRLGGASGSSLITNGNNVTVTGGGDLIGPVDETNNPTPPPNTSELTLTAATSGSSVGYSRLAYGTLTPDALRGETVLAVASTVPDVRFTFTLQTAGLAADFFQVLRIVELAVDLDARDANFTDVGSTSWQWLNPGFDLQGGQTYTLVFDPPDAAGGW